MPQDQGALRLLTRPGLLPPIEDDAWDLVATALTERLWVYRTESGGLIRNVLSFLPNGEIASHDSASERTWSFDGECLRLHGDDGGPHTIFDRCTIEEGRLLLGGTASSASGDAPVCLEARHRYRRPSGDTSTGLFVEMSIWRPDRPLLAMFNGGGTPYNERGVSLDFYRLPTALGVDAIRFAEDERHFARYLDKMQLIQKHLEYGLSFGHRRIILFGFSASGYACILLAEQLAERYPGLSFATVLVNVQTVLDAESEAHLAATIQGRFLSPIWGDWSLDVVDDSYVPVQELVRRRAPGRANVRHLVLYDSGNEAELYHTAFLADLPGVALRPICLGMGHGDGITEMFRRGDIASALRDAMDAA